MLVDSSKNIVNVVNEMAQLDYDTIITHKDLELKLNVDRNDVWVYYYLIRQLKDKLLNIGIVLANVPQVRL